jgi:hypothetical protein
VSDLQNESAFPALKLTRYQRLLGFGACELANEASLRILFQLCSVRLLGPDAGAEFGRTLTKGFVGGFGVSLLGAILLFLGATGAFASEFDPATWTLTYFDKFGSEPFAGYVIG